MPIVPSWTVIHRYGPWSEYQALPASVEELNYQFNDPGASDRGELAALEYYIFVMDVNEQYTFDIARYNYILLIKLDTFFSCLSRMVCCNQLELSKYTVRL